MKDRIITWISVVVILIGVIVSSAGLDQAWWTGITIAAMLCIFLVIQSVIIAKKRKSEVK